MDLKNFVGKKIGPYTDQASPDRVAAFIAAVGAKDRGEAPPTFMTVCRRGEFELLEQMGIPLSRVLHGEQEYLYEGRILSGDTLSYESWLAQAFEKKGSTPLQFLVFETHVSVAGKRVGTSKTTIIVRGGEGA